MSQSDERGFLRDNLALVAAVVVVSIIAVTMGLLLWQGSRPARRPQPVAVETTPEAGPKEETLDASPFRAPGVTEAESRLMAESRVKGLKSGRFPFVLYGDHIASNFYPSGWMGDYSDLRSNSSWRDNPHSGTSCIRIEYLPKSSQNANWAGVYWVFPNSKWGQNKGGYDLTGAKKLTFWARGENGGEILREVKVGGIGGQYPDSVNAGIGPITLTPEWRKYEIDLEGADLSYLSGGFSWVTNLELNPTGSTFYLDDIVYE